MMRYTDDEVFEHELKSAEENTCLYCGIDMGDADCGPYCCQWCQLMYEGPYPGPKPADPTHPLSLPRC